jgi:hypothetical protein
MALQLSVSVRNARLDQIESAVGTAPKLRLYTGSAPADCATAATGTLLCEITLPSDWLAAAASGSKAKAGTWSGTGAAAGNAGYYRVYDSGGTTCHLQGTVTATGGGGDMTLDNINIAVVQVVTINSYTITDGNA